MRFSKILLVCFALTVGLPYYVFAKPVYYAHALVHLDPIGWVGHIREA